MKKLLALTLALALLLTTAAMAEPFGEGKSLSLSCLEGWYSAVTINDNLPIWQEIEKNTGVHIEWEAISDYDTAIQPRVAAGQELPDMMLIPPSWSNAGVYKMAVDGTIIPLDDLIEEHAPHIKALLEANPTLKGLLTAPDGHIYTICDAPMFVNDMVVQCALFIREDWLKEFGLEVPATIDDWHNVLTAFKGKTDTVFGMDPVPFATSGTVMEKVNVFTCSFGLPAQVGMWWYDEDGKVFFTYTSDAYKAYLTEMAKWYAEAAK